MEENILRIFAQSTSRYFSTVARASAIVHPPYLWDVDDLWALDYSAVIGISGTYKGSVFYTAPREMLELLLPHLGEKVSAHDLCADLVGEITNTVSGNARELLGSGFMISTPLILGGAAYEVNPAKDCASFVIPIEWGGHRSILLVSLAKMEN